MRSEDWFQVFCCYVTEVWGLLGAKDQLFLSQLSWHRKENPEISEYFTASSPHHSPTPEGSTALTALVMPPE